MTTTTYTYNPVTFDASDYTEVEMQQLMFDICSGTCKPEFTVGGEISADAFRLERYNELMFTLANERMYLADGYVYSTIPVTPCNW